MSDSVLYLDKFRTKKKSQQTVTQQEETDIYINGLKDEFDQLLNYEKKGGGKHGCTRKNDRKRT